MREEASKKSISCEENEHYMDRTSLKTGLEGAWIKCFVVYSLLCPPMYIVTLYTPHRVLEI